MCENDEANFYELLLLTCQACQPSAKPLTPGAMNLIFEDVARYDFKLVKAALQAHRQDPDRGQWLPSAAHIEHQIEKRRTVSWLTADEAWARLPVAPLKPGMINGRKDYRQAEPPPTLLNDVTAAALAVAQPFINSGDESAARMSFRACYNRLVDKAKIERRGPVYFVSPGGTFEQQEYVREEGVRLGLLKPRDKAEQLLLQEDQAGMARIRAMMSAVTVKAISHE